MIFNIISLKLRILVVHSKYYKVILFFYLIFQFLRCLYKFQFITVSFFIKIKIKFKVILYQLYLIIHLSCFKNFLLNISFLHLLKIFIKNFLESYHLKIF